MADRRSGGARVADARGNRPERSPWPVEHFDPDVFRRIAPHVQERVSTLSEVPGMVDFLFFEHPIIDPAAWATVAADEEAKAILDAAISCLRDHASSSPRSCTG